MTVRLSGLSPLQRRRSREFAELLEGSRSAVGHDLQSLVALAATLRPAPLAARPEFRATLRATLVAEAERLAPARRAAALSARTSTPGRRTTTGRAPGRWRTAVAGGVLAATVAGAGAAVASSSAVPGDALYGLKRGIESAQLHLATSDLARGRDYLAQADHRLDEAERLTTAGDAGSPANDARIAEVLGDLTTSTRDGAQAMNESYADTGDRAALVELGQFVTEQQRRLAVLEPKLDPTLRPAVTSARQFLAVLGTAVSATLSGSGDAASLAGALSSITGAGGGTTGSTGNGGVLGSGSVVDGVPGTGSDPGSGSGSDGGGGTVSLPTVSASVGSVPAISAPDASVPPVSVPPASVPPVSVSVPPVGGVSVPAVTRSAPTVSVPAVSVPAVSVPAVSPSVPSASVSVPVVGCVPVPPLTHC